MSTKMTPKNLRMSFNDLWVAKSPKDYPDSPPKFSITLLVPKGSDTDKQILAAIEAEAKLAYGADWNKMLERMKYDSRAYCYSDGDESKHEEFAGHMVLNSKSTSRPKVINRDRTDVDPQDGVFYSGCYVNPVFDIYAQGKPNAGIRSGFKGVQFNKDGDAFVGSAPARDSDFEDLSDLGDDDNSDLA